MGNIFIKSDADLAEMREACKLAARTLIEAAKLIEPGVTTDTINRFVHDYTIKRNAKPAPLGYRGYPKSVCTSINEVICHGIPSDRRLLEGDIINVDVTSILNGWHGDVSATFFVGEVSDAAKALVTVTRECLNLAIDKVKPRTRLGDIGAVIQHHAESHGYSVVRDFVGHGIGRHFHEAPQVLHFGKSGRGQRLLKGMTFTIEPMINQGDFRSRILDDDWTAVTIDGMLSAQFEHTIAVTDDGVEVLTAFDEPLLNCDIFK
ncbi:MAG: type I methionyl aminopeptidase [Deltaproteobacteria bacterium]|nr:type I methionyl aminopeptidase [Deltaproteobacteria bacterium]